METAADRLEAALGLTHRSIRSLHLALRARAVPGSSYANVHAILKDPNRTPKLDFLQEAAAELGVRFAWLATGQGGMTEVEDLILAETGVDLRPGHWDVFNKQVQRRFPDFNLLGPLTQSLFLRVLTRYALTAPDGERLADSGDGLEQLLEMAGDILAYILLPWHRRSWGFVSIGNEMHERQIEQFTLTLLTALNGLLATRGCGQLTQAVDESLLRQVAQRSGVLGEPTDESTDAVLVGERNL